MAAKTTRARLYEVWNGMKRRCYDTTHKGYKYYGARGISISDDWLTFDNFYKDMAPTYEPGLHIDRVDNEKGYTANNCSWLNQTENNWKRSFNTTGQSSKYTGVCYNKLQDEWIAGIRVEGKRVHLGTFSNEIDAALAYDSKCYNLRGEKAKLNQNLFQADFVSFSVSK